MNSNIKPAYRAPVMAVLNPISQSPATVVTGYVSMSMFQNILALLQVGVLGSGATVDAKLVQATDSSGTSAKDIAGKAITQLTQAGTDANKQVEINCSADELDVANGFTHVALSVTSGSTASLISAAVLGFDARYEPATDATTVDEII